MEGKREMSMTEPKFTYILYVIRLNSQFSNPPKTSPLMHTWEAPAPGATLVLAAWCEHPGQRCVKKCEREEKEKGRAACDLPLCL
jgi:hypothetical protein